MNNRDRPYDLYQSYMGNLSNYDSIRINRIKRGISKTEKIEDLKKEVDELKTSLNDALKQVETLTNLVSELNNMILFMPGGPICTAAADDFKKLSSSPIPELSDLDEEDNNSQDQDINEEGQLN